MNYANNIKGVLDFLTDETENDFAAQGFSPLRILSTEIDTTKANFYTFAPISTETLLDGNLTARESINLILTASAFENESEFEATAARVYGILDRFRTGLHFSEISENSALILSFDFDPVELEAGENTYSFRFPLSLSVQY